MGDHPGFSLAAMRAAIDDKRRFVIENYTQRHVCRGGVARYSGVKGGSLGTDAAMTWEEVR
jgi:hypothetical protein